MKLTLISLVLLTAAVISALLAGSSLGRICDEAELLSLEAADLALAGDLDAAAELIGRASELWKSTEVMCELLFIRKNCEDAERSLALARQYALAGDGALCCGELRRAAAAIGSLRDADRLSFKRVF